MNMAANSFQKLLPTHSQMREDEDPDNLPRFGEQTEELHEGLNMAKPELDEIDQEVDKLLGPAPEP